MKNNYKHGHWTNGKPSITHSSWGCMKQRCTNPNTYNYNDYGGRGITYDHRWESFENFLADMGERPEGTTLDRIDNDGNYCKDNCRWSTGKEQCSNRRIPKPRSDNSSGHQGISWRKDRNKWQVRLMYEGKYRTFGCYETLQEAVDVKENING